MEPLARWEVETMEALAQEAFEREAAQIEIRFPEQWINRAISDRQAQARDDAAYRKNLSQHADRLGIGHVHPGRPVDDPTHQPASEDIARRWRAIQALMRELPRDDPWRILHADAITRNVIDARTQGVQWFAPGDGITILETLEAAARRRQQKPTAAQLAQQLMDSLSPTTGPPDTTPGKPS